MEHDHNVDDHVPHGSAWHDHHRAQPKVGSRGRLRRRRDAHQLGPWRDRLDSMPDEWLDQTERWFEEAADLVRQQRDRRAGT